MLEKVHNFSHRKANKRARLMVKKILPLITGIGPALDFGCGMGHIGFQIFLETGRKVHFLDIKNYPFTHPKVKVEVYDGGTIPYPDNFFETSFVMFTLHHTNNPKTLLSEIVRVTNGNIVICEDLLKSRKYIFKEVLKDMISNCCYLGITKQYRTEKEWEYLFEDYALQIVNKVYFDSKLLFRMNHVGWQLNINGGK